MGTAALRFAPCSSLEPATISGRYYPELFQQGETTFGRPIVDGQHPHDFVMELALLYDRRLGENTLLSVYAAPRGAPAMGPSAYPHRSSASEDPIAPLGHHLEDSTHIANEVITLGIAHRNLRLEASGFEGREPDEHRWDLDTGKIDSWSIRTTANFGQSWSLQYSLAQLHSPEVFNPNEDLRRMTASLMYARRVGKGSWSSMLLWGRNQSLKDRNRGNSLLLESTLQFAKENYAWTRIESADRTNELLPKVSPGERYFARVQAYTLGYDRLIGHLPYLSTAIGGQLTWYGVPEVLEPVLGSRPWSALLFLHVRPRHKFD